MTISDNVFRYDPLDDLLRTLGEATPEPESGSEEIDNEAFLRELEQFVHEENVETVRDAAEREAREEAARRAASYAESNSRKILKKKTTKTMDGVREHIKNARRKERMRTVSHYLCDACDETILNPEDGYVVQGNIYVADPSCRGGLVGNAFPDPSPDGTIQADEVKETVFCKLCLLDALGMSASYSLNSKPKVRTR